MIDRYLIQGEEIGSEFGVELLTLGLNTFTAAASGRNVISSGNALRKMLKEDRVAGKISGTVKRLAADNGGYVDFSVKLGGKGSSYYHSCGDSVADIIADTGFRTDIPNEIVAFHNNRYGRGVYLADTPQTALAERPGGTILKVSANTGKNLDITNRGIIGGDDYTLTHAIARGARKHGYDSITFSSAKNLGGINTVILDPKNVIVEEVIRK